MAVDRHIALEAVPAAVRHIGDVLGRAGHAAFLVGGSLRDLLRGRTPHDWDVATAALPQRVRELFPRSAPTGERYGTVTVFIDGGAYEVTTLRRESGYVDHRHPVEIDFTESIEEDLARRDFTVNAMALDLESGELHDPFGGIEDLGHGLIRAVGEARARFLEDPLRLVRACRLAAQLEMAVEVGTAGAMTACAPEIDHVAPERLHDELLRLLAGTRQPSSGLVCMLRAGILDRLMPELTEALGVTQNRFHRYDVLTHALFACDLAPQEKPLVRMAALLHDVAKPATRELREDGEATFYGHQVRGAELVARVLRRLRFSRSEIELVVGLVRHHMFQYHSDWSDAAVRRFIRKVGEARLEDLFDLRRADATASGRDQDRSRELEELWSRITHELADAQAGYQRQLAVSGRDVMEVLEIGPGPEVGRVLSRLEDMVLEAPKRNTRDQLISLLNEWKRQVDK